MTRVCDAATVAEIAKNQGDMLMEKRLLALLLSALFFVLGGCANSLVKQSAGLDRGMTKAQVLQVMGPPANKQFKDLNEAWQYCELGAMAGDFLMIWFYDGVVTVLTQWTDSSPAFDCTNRLRSVRWEDAPTTR
jgi:hypothetical protein